MSIVASSHSTPRSQGETFYHDNTPPSTILRANNALLDEQIDGLQQRYADHNNREVIDDDIAQTSQAMAELFDSLSTAHIDSWNDYFRLLSHCAFFEQRVKIPTAFSTQQEWQERKALTNGVYGVNAAIIESALALHDHPDTDDTERMQLRGAIHEQTASALLNYPQRPSTIALPASLTDDLMNTTDIDYWRIEGKIATRTGLQVKSHLRTGVPLVTTSGSIIVTAKDFGNTFHHTDKLSLVTSRLIVADVSDRGLDQVLKNHLDSQHAQFMSFLSGRITLLGRQND